MGKTRKINKSNKGGRVIASGGYGCVFDPALKCEDSSKSDYAFEYLGDVLKNCGFEETLSGRV